MIEGHPFSLSFTLKSEAVTSWRFLRAAYWARLMLDSSLSRTLSLGLKALPGLVKKAGRKVRVARVIGDGAYDSGGVYGMLEGRGVEAVIKPRKNSRLDTRCPGRRLAVGRVRELGYEG